MDNIDMLENEGEYEVEVLSGILYTILPDGLPEFALAVQVKVDSVLYIHPLVLGTNVKRVPDVGEVIQVKYYENFYCNRYNRCPEGRWSNEERFILVEP